MQSSDVFDPQSPFARAIQDLFNTTLIISAVILALVTGLVIYVLARFRKRQGPQETYQLHGHTTLEIVWTVIPLLLLAYLSFLTVQAMRSSDPHDKTEEPDVIVIGRQFWWEVRYPKSGVVTANEVHIPVGRRMLFQVETADVIHDFWVPQLGRKMDLMPDRANRVWLQADKPGVYHGACAEFCGIQHAWMRILVVAVSTNEFEAWQSRQAESARLPQRTEEEQGALLFQQRTCVNCHAVKGVSAPVQAGPDLTHVASRRTLGAGVLQNTPENLARWVRHPQQVKPGNFMPDMLLSEDEMRNLIAYLLTLQ